jgi:type II secretory pathway component PulF
MFSRKVPLPALVAWCRILKHSVGAGLPVERIFRQLAKSGAVQLRPVAADVAGKLEQGESLEDALEPYRDRFPPLFVELVAIGEQSGQLEDTFRELEQYYETTMRVQRNFRSQMAYPAIQFVLAVLVIAAFIFIIGMITPGAGLFGLSGGTGAVTFLVLAFGIVGGLLYLFKLTADNARWRAKFEGMGLAVPGWGGAFLNFALHRFCVALRMTHEAGLKPQRALHYSFRATANAAFQAREDRAVAVVKKGGEVHEAMVACGAPFPSELVDAILVAETTGQITEVCERMADAYREEGERKLKLAAQFTGYLLYGLVAVFIIIAIFSIAGGYVGMINKAVG